MTTFQEQESAIYDIDQPKPKGLTQDYLPRSDEIGRVPGGMAVTQDYLKIKS